MHRPKPVLVYFCSLAKSLIFTIENYIDGTEFLNLTGQDVKSMIPALGIANKIIRLLPEKVP